MSAKAVAASLGVLFWLTAARGFAPEQVGVAAAAISLQTLLGLVASLGIGITGISELPKQDAARQRTWILRGLACVAGGAVIAAVLFGSIGAWFSSNLERTLTDPLGAIIFVTGVVAAGAAMVFDEVTLGLTRSAVQVLRNTVAASLRFPFLGLLLVLGAEDSRAIQLAWVLPILVSLAAAWWRLHLPKAKPDVGFRRDLSAYRGLAGHNYALSLSVALSTQLIPIAAAVVLTATENAEFAIAWLIATLVFLPPFLLSTALFSHGARVTPEEFTRDMGRTIPFGLAISAVLIVGAAALGKPVLTIFGGTYSDASYTLLLLLTPAGLWMVVKDHLIARWRTENKHRLAIAFALVGVIAESSGALIGGSFGGGPYLCLGWLLGILVEVVVLSPWIRSGLRGVKPNWDLRTLVASKVASGRGEQP